jgi:prophage antirepressor-like protein
MNAMTSFNFNDAHNVRVMTREGDPWFVAADVCRALGMTTVNTGTSRLLTSLSAHEKATTPLSQVEGRSPQPTNIISEQGLYRLVMRSDKPEARAFQDWVTGTVLPAIRKDGAYIMGEEKVATGELSEDEFVLRAYDMLRRKVDRLQAERDQLKAANDVMAPKAVLAESHILWGQSCGGTCGGIPPWQRYNAMISNRNSAHWRNGVP